MTRVWTSGVPWKALLRMPPRSWSLVLCIAVIGGCSPNAAFQEPSHEAASAPAYQVNGGALSASGNVAPLPLEDDGAPEEGPNNPLPHKLVGLSHIPDVTLGLVSEERQSAVLGPAKGAALAAERRPTQSKRSLRLGEPFELAEARARSQVDMNTESSEASQAALPGESDQREVQSDAISSPPPSAEMGEYPTGKPLKGPLEPPPQLRTGRSPEETEEHYSSALEESADPRKALEGPLNFNPSDSVSIPSPLAHSLLYRTRDIANPLNLANFLAEGQEWLIPGSGSLWEGLGRRVDSLFSGLFLKTARVLPDYRRNVIICYKEYKPSMWIEMFGLRNQFLRHLASLFQGTHRMQSVYLRNLGMEIFEVPPLWRVGEFVATVLKLKQFVSHVYTDHLVTDFDHEIQAPWQGRGRSRDIWPPAEVHKNQTPENKRHLGNLHNSPFVPADGGERRRASRDTTPPRRLEVMTNDPFTWQQWAIVDSGPSRWGIEAPTAWDVWTGKT